MPTPTDNTLELSRLDDDGAPPTPTEPIITRRPPLSYKIHIAYSLKNQMTRGRRLYLCGYSEPSSETQRVEGGGFCAKCKLQYSRLIKRRVSQ